MFEDHNYFSGCFSESGSFSTIHGPVASVEVDLIF
jgi:hypothetical protein